MLRKQWKNIWTHIHEDGERVLDDIFIDRRVRIGRLALWAAGFGVRSQSGQNEDDDDDTQAPTQTAVESKVLEAQESVGWEPKDYGVYDLAVTEKFKRRCDAQGEQHAGLRSSTN